MLFVVISVFGLSFSPAHAATGLDYLSAQQNSDGSFGNTATSLATPAQSTPEVLRAYQALGQQALPAYAPALGYLNGDAEANTEFLARKAGNDVTALINTLSASQNTDGGFGNQPGNSTSVLDTAYALEALAAANYTSGTLVSSAAGYLLGRQTTSGGSVDGANDPSVFISAQAMRALWFYRNTYVGVSATLANAQNFLLAQRGPDGAWSEPFVTALALLALVPNVSDLALVDGTAARGGIASTANNAFVPYGRTDSNSPLATAASATSPTSITSSASPARSPRAGLPLTFGSLTSPPTPTATTPNARTSSSRPDCSALLWSTSCPSRCSPPILIIRSEG